MKTVFEKTNVDLLERAVDVVRKLDETGEIVMTSPGAKEEIIV